MDANCPFCGSNFAGHRTERDDEGVFHWVECAECGARGPRVEQEDKWDFDLAADDAADAWESRA